MLLAGTCPLDHTNFYDPATPVSLSISGPAVSHGIGDTLLYTAAVDPRWTGGPPQWFSSDLNVIRLVASGRYVTAGVGTADIIAQIGAHQARTTLTVTQVLAGMAVRTCGGVSTKLIYLGQSLPLCPTLVDSSGGSMGGTISAVLASSDPSIVTVVGSGGRAVANGTAWIRGSAQGYTDSLQVTVQQLPGRLQIIGPNPLSLPGGGTVQQLTWQAYDIGGSAMPPGSPNWGTNRPGVIDVSQSGLVTATGWGVATITARLDTATARLAVQTTGGSAPSLQSASASYLTSQGVLMVRTDVIDPQADGASVSIDGSIIPLSRTTGVQPADQLFGAVTTAPLTVAIATRDESGNAIDTTIAVDTTYHDNAPVVLSVTAHGLGADSIWVDFTAQDNEMDAVEAWLVVVRVPYGLSLMTVKRFTLAPSSTPVFSSSIGTRDTTQFKYRFGVLVRDATGAISQVVVAVPTFP